MLYKQFGSVILPVGLLLLAGCTTTHTFVVPEPVRAGSPEPASADSFGTVIEKTTVVECPTNSMVEMRIKRDFFNSLLGAITLGLYQSTSVEYVCGKRPDDDVPVLGANGAPGENHGGE